MTTSRPATLPPLTNSTQRSSDGGLHPWPPASVVRCQPHLIGAGRQRLAVGFYGSRDVHGAERHAPVRGRRRAWSAAALRGRMAFIRRLPALAGRLRKGSACRERSHESSHENQFASFLPPIESATAELKCVQLYRPSAIGVPQRSKPAQRFVMTILPLNVRMVNVRAPVADRPRVSLAPGSGLPFDR